MNLIEQILAGVLLDNEIVALKFAAGQEREAAKRLAALKEIAVLALANVSPASQERAISEFSAGVTQVFRDLTEAQTRELAEFAALTQTATVSVLNGALAVDLFVRPNRISPQVEAVILDGAPTSEWWARQADNTRRAFAREIKIGFVSGETTDAITRRIIGTRETPGILDISIRQARALVHSSVMTVANASTQEVLAANDDIVKGYYWVSTLDSRTCAVCGSRDQKKYSLQHRPVGHNLSWGSGPGAIHVNCRCTTTPWLKSMRELGLDIDDFQPSTRASAEGPVDGNLTFESWVESRPPQQQEAYFGKGRYDLYKAGKITLRDLTTMTGRERTLDELRRRYE